MQPYCYLGNGIGLTHLSGGEVFFVDTNTHDITTWILLGGIWETFVDDILCALAQPGDTFVDVGANVGYYTVKIGSRVGPNGQVYAVEANPELFNILSKNIEINGRLSWSKAFNVAAGAEAGQMPLAFERVRSGGGSISLPGHLDAPNTEKCMVPVEALDKLLPGDCRVDLMKIDVEGFEPFVLDGMRDLLSRSPDAAIITEVSSAHWARVGDPAEILNRFAEGRKIFRIYYDGFIKEIDKDNLTASLDPNFVSYVLLLPFGSPREHNIRRFFRKSITDSESVATEARVDVIPPPQPSSPPTLLSRLRRLMS
jgi:FkbM family methyltransferase